MESGTDPPGKMECTGDTERTQTVQFIRIVNDLRFQCDGYIITPVAVGTDDIGNVLDERFIPAAVFPEDLRRFPRTDDGMTAFSAGCQFFGTGDVMEKRAAPDRIQVVGIFFFCDPQGIGEDPEDMREVMTPGSVIQFGFCPCVKGIPESRINCAVHGFRNSWAIPD